MTTTVLVIHGFTGAPSSFEPQLASFEELGFELSVPLLPGHGTSVEDLSTKVYSDFLAAATEALQRVEGRSDLFIMGLSMGGTLAADLASRYDVFRGIILINPMLVPPAESYISVVDQLIMGGVEYVDSIGSDIAKENSRETSYSKTPLRTARSLFDGVKGVESRVESIAAPVLLFTSRQDHVVPTVSSEFLVERLGDKVEHHLLERSYHVATLDYDAQFIAQTCAEFIDRLVVGEEQRFMGS